jgi:hypothetical protein
MLAVMLEIWKLVEDVQKKNFDFAERKADRE